MGEAGPLGERGLGALEEVPGDARPGRRLGALRWATGRSPSIDRRCMVSTIRSRGRRGPPRRRAVVGLARPPVGCAAGGMTPSSNWASRIAGQLPHGSTSLPQLIPDLDEGRPPTVLRLPLRHRPRHPVAATDRRRARRLGEHDIASTTHRIARKPPRRRPSRTRGDGLPRRRADWQPSFAGPRPHHRNRRATPPRLARQSGSGHPAATTTPVATTCETNDMPVIASNTRSLFACPRWSPTRPAGARGALPGGPGPALRHGPT